MPFWKFVKYISVKIKTLTFKEWRSLKKKRLLEVFVAIGIVMSLNVSVLADPLSDLMNEKSSQEQMLQNQNNTLKQAQSKVDQLEMIIQQMDSQIETMMAQIEKNKKDIAKGEEDIVQAQKAVEQAQTDIDTQQKLFDDRMRAMYKNGDQGYLDVILGADGFSDLVSRIETVTKIIQFDKKVVKDLNDKKVVLQQKKQTLNEENTKLKDLEKANEQKLADMTKTKNDELVVVNQAKDEQKKYASQVSSTQSAINAAEQKIKQLRDAAPKYDPSRGISEFSTDKVVVYASNFRGTPYVWGGTSPRPGFDCSGFVQYVYAHFGIGLGRTTYDQIDEGAPVDKNNLQPGDLVFFGNSSAPHHVGIYIGGNCYIHSPETGDVVKISELTRSDFCAARRVR